MKRYFLLCLTSLIGILYSQTTQVLIGPPGLPQNFIVPCGVTSITVNIFGGGGGGAGDATAGNGISGGGGGGGGFSSTVIAVVPGQSIPYIVGAGGTLGAAGGNGGNGGTTTFNGVSATGGLGGQATGVGGAGGVGNVANGGNGGIGGAASGAGGASGGGAAGGASQPGDANGLNGGAPGGGGSGGNHINSGTNTGGAGGAGLITVTYAGPNAGPDQYLSCTNSTVMAANTPSGGTTGTWTQIAGPACTIVSPNSPTTAITGMAVPSVCTFRWTWAAPPAGCTTKTDDVIINAGICSDEPCSASPLTVNATCSYTNFANLNSTASVAYGQPGCGNYNNNDMWYSAVIPACGYINVQTVDAAGGTNMLPCFAFYSGSCASLMHQGCNESSTLGVPASGTYVGTPGETVYIRVWDYNNTEGVYSICAFTPACTPGTIQEGINTLTCAGAAVSFVDPGGTTGNYTTSSSALYRICPDVPGQFVTVTFTSFNLQNGFDYLTVIDGGGPDDPYIGNYTGATLPPTITSSAADGCLSFAFYSDATTVASGWIANVDCSGTAGVNTPFCSSTNCAGECGTWICQDGLFPTYNAGSVGVQELLEQTAGCLGGAGEVSTQWFYFTALSTGSIGFNFNGPNGQNYDFAIWGPDTTGEPPCPLNTQMAPIRCSFADINSNPTGLQNGAGDFYEGINGNNFVEDLDVVAGQTYAMVLNIYQNGNPQPIIDLDINGTGTLDCTPLPVQLLNFDGLYDDGYNRVRWTSAQEMNNDYYTLLYSDNAVDYEVLTVNPGIGNSNVQTQYGYSHISPYAITYYKLRQTDYDGHSKEFGPISISKMSNGPTLVMHLYPNPASGYVNISCDYDGGALTLNLIDNLGRVMTSQQIMGQGINQMDIQGIPSGVYYLQVVSDHGIERIEKLIIQ